MSALPKRTDELELSLWAPRIETAPPVAPGSASSEEASAVIEPYRAKSHRRILECLAAADRPLTREEICARTKMKESSACGRIFELAPTWVTVHSKAGKAASGLPVDTYEITPAALRKMQARAA